MAYSRTVFQCVLIGCVLHLASAKRSGPNFEEPVCSKFHFEEHVLEKLVRLDFRVEQMGEHVQGELVDLKEKATDLKTGLDTLAEEQEKERTDLNDLKAGLDTLGEEQKNDRTDLNDLKAGIDTLGEEQEKERTDLNDLKAELGAEMSDLREEVAMLKKELGQKQSTGSTKGVAFVARNPPTSLPSKTLIHFRTTVLNVGDAYDDSTGRFTAPVSGIYSFSAQLCTTSTNVVHFQLIVNNKILGVSRQYEKSASGVCSSMTTVATMQAGEQAWVNCATCNTGVVVVGDNVSAYWNMFTGVLVTPN